MRAGLIAALSVLMPYEVTAEVSQRYDGWEIAVGILLHDQSPFADHHEEGHDLNAEVMFPRPRWDSWTYLLDPRPHVGLNANLNGDTGYFLAA